jgi:hypothetical protein
VTDAIGAVICLAGIALPHPQVVAEVTGTSTDCPTRA